MAGRVKKLNSFVFGPPEDKNMLATSRRRIVALIARATYSVVAHDEPTPNTGVSTAKVVEHQAAKAPSID